MKKMMVKIMIFFMGFHHFMDAAQPSLDQLTIPQAVERDIKNIKDGAGNPTDSLVQQMTNRLLELKKLTYPNFADRNDPEVQTLQSNVGEYNNEYAADWSDPNPNYDNFEQRLRRLGNDQVAPKFQVVSDLQ